MQNVRMAPSPKVKAVLILFAIVVSGTFTGSALAELRFAHVFSGNMVLQQKKPIPTSRSQ